MATGGIIQLDPNDPNVQIIANWTVSRMGHYSLIKVESASAQVVSGFIWRLQLLVQNCYSGRIDRVFVSVWQKPWEGYIELTSVRRDPRYQHVYCV